MGDVYKRQAQIVFRVRGVHRYDIEILELRRNDAAFFAAIAPQLVRELEPFGKIIRKALNDGNGLFLRENCRARITLLDCRIPIFVITGQVDLNLSALCFGFL